MDRDTLVALAKSIAAAHQLDPAVVCGICERETSWNPWVVRYEPAFMSKYVAPIYIKGGMAATEAWTRGMSWGLMQVMGQTARELGFDAPQLSRLCDPAAGIEFGCRKLAGCLKRTDGNVNAALLAYNGGANKSYAGEVLKMADAYRILVPVAVPVASPSPLPSTNPVV